MVAVDEQIANTQPTLNSDCKLIDTNLTLIWASQSGDAHAAGVSHQLDFWPTLYKDFACAYQLPIRRKTMTDKRKNLPQFKYI